MTRRNFPAESDPNKNPHLRRGWDHKPSREQARRAFEVLRDGLSKGKPIEGRLHESAVILYDFALAHKIDLETLARDLAEAARTGEALAPAAVMAVPAEVSAAAR